MIGGMEMRKIFGLLCICVLGFSCLLNINAADEIPQEVIDIAEEAYNTAKMKIESSPEQYGIKETDCLITLGAGFPINYVDEEKLKSGLEMRANELIDHTIIKHWRFTVDADGVPKTYITIGIENGAYKLVGYGDLTEAYGVAREQAATLEKNADYKLAKQLYQFGGKFYFVVGDKVLPVNNVPNSTEISIANAKTNINTYMNTTEWMDTMLQEQGASAMYNEDVRGAILGDNIERDALAKSKEYKKQLIIFILCIVVVGSIVIWVRRKSVVA